ncbi:hypothetical protein EBZ37_14575 [bacterium]|nr:hypothetical protein [bacterium]
MELGLVSSIEQRELIIVSRVFAYGLRLEKVLDLLLNRNLIGVESVITSMQMDPDSLITYRLVSLVLSHLEARKNAVRKELEDSISSDQLVSQLEQLEKVQKATVTALLANSPDTVRAWIMRRWRIFSH